MPLTENKINGLILLLIVATASVLIASEQTYTLNLLSRAIIYSLAGVGLNLALGAGGMVSLGHAAFFGIGAYVAGIAAHHAFDESVFSSWPVALGGSDQMLLIWLVAMAISALIALLIGAISLRTSGVYFIMITLAFAQMIYYFSVSWPAYGGEDGLSIYTRNQLPLVDTGNTVVFFITCLFVLVVVLLISAKITSSKFGTALEVARMNETRLATAGIHPYPIKLSAFVISAMITALAGALFADLNRFVSPSMLSWHTSGEMIVFVLLGGVGRLYGPVIGAFIFVLLEAWLGGITQHWQLFLGLVLLIVVLFANGGVMGLLCGEKKHG